MEEVGHGGRFLSGLQGKGSLVFGAAEGSSRLWTGSWEGKLGAGVLGPLPPAPRLWWTTATHCYSCHGLACSGILSFYHFSYPSPYTSPDSACPLLPKSSYSIISCLWVRKSHRCSVVSKHNPYTKFLIYICLFCFIILNHTFSSYSILTGE